MREALGIRNEKRFKFPKKQSNSVNFELAAEVAPEESKQEGEQLKVMMHSPSPKKSDVSLSPELIIQRTIMEKYKQRKLRLLVANDNEFQLFVISNSLENLNFVEKIDTASNGQEALELVIKSERDYLLSGKLTYDIIFLDLEMPIKDGFEACEDILNFYQCLKRQDAHVLNSPKRDWIDDF